MVENNDSNLITWLKLKDDIFTEQEEELFYKNGEVLKNEAMNDEDDNKISKNEFEKIIKKEVSNLIDRNFKRIVLLTGAGSSVTGDFDNVLGKTMKDLIKSIIEKLSNNNDYFKVEEMIDFCQYSYDYPEENDDLAKKINLENLLSDIERFRPFTQADDKEKYENTYKKMLGIIRDETSYDYDKEYLHHTKVINRLARRVSPPNKLAIITTNYDTMFEEAADEINYSVIDGFTYSVKPHFDADQFEWRLVKNIPDVTTKELEYKPSTIDLLKIHGSVTWKRDEGKIYRRDKNKIDNPVLIFPTSNKFAQSYEEPYFDLFTKFQELLNNNNTLLVTSGFSFGDEHIVTMIKRAIMRNQGLTVLVTDYSLEQSGDGWGHIEELRKNGYPIIFLKSNFNQLADYF